MSVIRCTSPKFLWISYRKIITFTREEEGVLNIWDLGSLKNLKQISVGKTIDFDVGCAVFVYISDVTSNGFKIMDLTSGEILHNCHHQNCYTTLIANNTVVSCDLGHNIKFWEISTGNCLKSLCFPTKLLRTDFEAFSLRRGCKIVVNYPHNEVQVWDCSTGNHCFMVSKVFGKTSIGSNFIASVEDRTVTIFQ